MRSRGDKDDVVVYLIENEIQVQNDDRGDSILKEEFEKALRSLKEIQLRE